MNQARENSIHSAHLHGQMTAVYWALMLQAVASAGTFIVAKGALREIAPLTFGFYRFGLASVIFGIIMVARQRYFPYDKSELKLVVLLSILAIPINQGFFLFGLSLTPPTHPALLYATGPVWVYLISAWRKEESFDMKKSLGITIALIGVIAFFLEKGIMLALNDLLGDFLILIAVLAWAFYTVLGRPLAQKHGAMTVTASALVIGTIIYLPLGVYVASKFNYADVTWVGWTGVVYTAIITSVILYTLWYWIIKHIEPSKAAVFANLQPVLTAIMAYFIIGERLSIGSILSGIVVLAGVYITQKA
jgi:drug/metabolite transporter (DMT)-like permease